MTMVLFQLITGIGTLDIKTKNYIQGAYSDQGDFTLMALFGIILLLPELTESKIGQMQKWKIGVFVSCLITYGYSAGRGALVSAVAVIVSYALMTKKYKYPLLSILGGILFTYLSPTVQEVYWAKTGKEIQFIKGADIKVETLGSGRIGRWLSVIDDFREAGLLEKIFGTGSTIGPHGQYFDLLKKVGIFGLVVTVAFFLKIFKDLYKIVRRDQTNILALQTFLFCIAILVLGLTSNPLSQYYLLIAFFALLAMLEKQQKLKPIGLSTL